MAQVMGDKDKMESATEFFLTFIYFVCGQLSAHMRTKHHNMQKLDLYHGL
jgi:hypothetical protein